MHENLVSDFVSASLEKLQVDYIDLYLLHSTLGAHFHSMTEALPKKDGKIDVDFNTDLEAVWRGMEAQVETGKVRAIGISNFNSQQVKLVWSTARVKPSILQVRGTTNDSIHLLVLWT